MTNFYVGLMLITAATVGKIILSSSAGMVISRYFDTPESSVKGLSYIAMRVSLPCLLFTNLCLAVTWEQLGKFYWAPLFGCVPMILGFLCSFLVRRFLTKEYRYVVILASTFQNSLTFPVSILINLKGIDWFTGQAVADAQSYTFLYNLICNIGLYSIGEPLVAWAKQKEVNEEEAARAAAEAEERRQQRLSMDATSQDMTTFENRSFAYPFESPCRESAAETLPSAESPTSHSKRDATALEQLGWYRQAGAKDKPITPPPGSSVVVLRGDADCATAAAAAQDGKKDSIAHFRKNVMESLTGGPNMASFLAIAVALTPPLRWFAQSFLGDALIGGMTLIGEGAIPLQLLVLGCTLVGPPSVKKTAEVKPAFPLSSGGTAAAAATTGAASSPNTCASGDLDETVLDMEATAEVAPDPDMNACMRAVTSMVSPQIIFTWCTIVLRLVVLPAACFLLLHLLVIAGLIPKERPFILAMLTEALSPSAMNSGLICAVHGYHAKDYSRMIFCQYVVCIFTTTIWLFFFVLYIERMT
ncbi:transporter [Lotmaria passim]